MDIASLRAELQLKQQELEQLHKSFEEYMESSKEMETELELMVREADAKYNEASKKNTALQSKLEVLTTSLSNEQRSSLKLQSEVDALKVSNEQLKKDKRNMENACEQLEDRVRILEATEADVSQKLERAEEDLVLAQGDFDSLQQTTQETERRFAEEIAELKSEIVVMRRNNSDAKLSGGGQIPEVAELLRELEALKIERANEVSARASAIAETEKKFIVMMERRDSEYNETILEMTQNSGHYEEEIIRLRHLVDAQKAEIDRLHRALAGSESEMDSMKRVVVHATQDVAEIQSKLVESLESTVANLNERLDFSEATASSLRASIARLQAEYAAAEGIFFEEKKSLQAEIVSAADVFYRQSETMKDEWRAERDELNLRILDMTQELEFLRAKAQAKESHAHGRAIVWSVTDAGIGGTETITEDANSIAGGENRDRELFSSTSAELSIQKAIVSQDIEIMKSELTRHWGRFEQMRSSNAKLLHKLQALKGNIQVCCRVRPLSEQEIFQGETLGVDVLDENELACFDKRNSQWRSFAFDKVWGPESTQEDVFMDVEPLVLSIVDGYNACIFASGQTSSGKTFTMNGYGSQYGVSYRTLHKLFEILQLKRLETERKAEVAALGQTWRDKNEPVAVTRDGETFNDVNESGLFFYSVKVSMMEIYNEQVRDLLNPIHLDGYGGNGSSFNAEGAFASLDIRQAADGTVSVPDLSQVNVSSLEDVLAVFARGSANRATATTNLNEHSSRSHSLLLVDVMTSIGGKAPVKGKLYLVDLAGSEKVHKSGVTGTGMKEAQFINRSLSALGDVMEALDSKAKHVPYRNSKLTFLLQDSLGGNSRTMMIATVCPTESNCDETLFSLQFATRVRNINLGPARKNIAAKNLEEALKAARAELKDAKKKIEDLSEALRQQKKIVEGKDNGPTSATAAMRTTKKSNVGSASESSSRRSSALEPKTAPLDDAAAAVGVKAERGLSMSSIAPSNPANQNGVGNVIADEKSQKFSDALGTTAIARRASVGAVLTTSTDASAFEPRGSMIPRLSKSPQRRASTMSSVVLMSPSSAMNDTGLGDDENAEPQTLSRPDDAAAGAAGDRGGHVRTHHKSKNTVERVTPAKKAKTDSRDDRSMNNSLNGAALTVSALKPSGPSARAQEAMRKHQERMKKRKEKSGLSDGNGEIATGERDISWR